MARKLIPFLTLLLTFPVLPLQAEEAVDLSMMTRIRDEGFRHSEVMDTLFNLTDVIGPRLTGSPQVKEANDWTRQRFESWGLTNAHLEAYPFGRGWTLSAFQVRMVTPRVSPLLAYPKAWTPGTSGPVRGEIVRADLKAEKDFAQYEGKLAGKILLLDPLQEFKEPENPQFERYTENGLEEVASYRVPGERPDFRAGGLTRWRFRKAFNEFLVKEKAAATVETGGRLNGIVRVSGGGSWEKGESVGVPALVMAAEHYNQLVRLLDSGRKVELEIEVAAQFHDEDLNGYDTVAEISGTDKKDEIVMAGAHLDSWHAGTGATDNGAGSAVVMEAARILKALGVKPRRTIRFALWTGEEEGLLGSIAYVKQHFATRPESKDPKQLELPERFRQETWPLQLKPEHAKLAAYFNLDNGTGKVRGIYGEENTAVQPIFEAWLAPFKDLGVNTVTLRTTGGTDHLSFDRVGLLGFQFIQDRMDYEPRTHHTNLDTYDHLSKDDLKQASVLMAAFLYDAAMRPEPLPRKPLPQEREKAPKPPVPKIAAPTPIGSGGN